MEGLLIFIGFMFGAFVASVITQMVTTINSIEDELGATAIALGGGIAGVVITDLLLQLF